MQNPTKKEKLAQYKERKVIGAVYLIKNTVNEKQLLLSTCDLQGSKNRFEFSQKTNSCVDLELQKDWDLFGGSIFFLEVVEQLEKKDTQTAKEFAEDIETLRELWLEKRSSDNGQ